MNENFTIFLEEFGEGKRFEVPTKDFFQKYESILPDAYLTFIKEQGFASYANGLFWTVPPQLLSNYAQVWLDRFDVLAGKAYYVFGRSAFGDLYAIQAETGRQVTISTVTGNVWASKKIGSTSKNFNLGVEAFFGGAYRKDFDMEDDEERSLFDYGTEKFGPLTANEMFGFVPALSVGGRISAECLRKVRLDVHLDLLIQMTSPTMNLV